MMEDIADVKKSEVDEDLKAKAEEMIKNSLINDDKEEINKLTKKADEIINNIAKNDNDTAKIILNLFSEYLEYINKIIDDPSEIKKGKYTLELSTVVVEIGGLEKKGKINEKEMKDLIEIAE